MQDLQIEDFVEVKANKAFESEIIIEEDVDDKDDNKYNESENDEQDKNISNSSSANTTWPTRGLKKVFYAMDMLKLPIKLGAFKDFIISYHEEALFVFDEDAKKRIKKVLCLKFNKIIFKAMLAQNPDCILKKSKRAVSPPDVFLPIIADLF
jgi:hypothetical protein